MDIQTWGHVFNQLVSLLPSHACKQYIEAFNLLRREVGYCPDNIPQLEDVSNFIRSTNSEQSNVLYCKSKGSTILFHIFINQDERDSLSDQQRDYLRLETSLPVSLTVCSSALSMFDMALPLITLPSRKLC
jgi:hypothetical protein